MLSQFVSELPSKDVLDDHGVAVWIAVSLLSLAVTYLAWLIKQQAKREQGLVDELHKERAFIRETLIATVKESNKVAAEATAVLKRLAEK